MDSIHEIAFFETVEEGKQYLKDHAAELKEETKNWGGTFYQIFKVVTEDTKLSFSGYEPLEGECPIGYGMAGEPRPYIKKLK